MLGGLSSANVIPPLFAGLHLLPYLVTSLHAGHYFLPHEVLVDMGGLMRSIHCLHMQNHVATTCKSVQAVSVVLSAIGSMPRVAGLAAGTETPLEISGGHCKVHKLRCMHSQKSAGTAGLDGG